MKAWQRATRMVVAAAGVAAILATTACGVTQKIPGTPSAAAAVDIAPPDAAPAVGAGSDAVQVCTVSLPAVLKDLPDAMMAGLVDPDVPDLDTAMRNALVSHGSQLRSEAAGARDAELRSALERTAVAAEELAGEPEPTIADPGSFDEATDDLISVCEDLMSSAAPGDTEPAATAGDGGTGPAATVGGEESPCRLPVSFELATSWEPVAVDVDALSKELASVLDHGPFDLVCQIGAAPEGSNATLRVYLAPDARGSLRKHLETFLANELPRTRSDGTVEVRDPTYTDIEVGGEPAAELRYDTYTTTSEAVERHAAFAVNTTSGAVVVKLNSSDVEEHEELLPAYDLAKRTFTVND